MTISSKKTVSELRNKRPGRPLGNQSTKTIQLRAIEAAHNILGIDIWTYGSGSGRRCERMAEVLEAARWASGCSMSYQKFFGILSFYTQYGEVPVLAKGIHHKRKSINGIRARGVNARFTAADEAVLRDIIDNQPQLYLDEIQEEVKNKTGKVWDASTLWRHLQNMKYSLQVAVYKANQQTVEEVADYHYRLIQVLNKHPNQLIYVDETAKGANASRRRRAWSQTGQTAYIKDYFQHRHDKRFTMIGACDCNGFVKSACEIVEREQGKNDTDPNRGTVDGERFLEYVRDCLVPALGNYINGERRSIVVMDNASIHNANEIRNLIESAGAILIYTAPYAPEYNPIELMFGDYKRAIQKSGLKMRGQTGIERGKHEWYYQHLDALNSVEPQKAANYFRKCSVPLVSLLYENTISETMIILFDEVLDLVEDVVELITA